MSDEKPQPVPATASVPTPTANPGVAAAQSAGRPTKQFIKDHHLTAPNEGTN